MAVVTIKIYDEYVTYKSYRKISATSQLKQTNCDLFDSIQELYVTDVTSDN